MFSGNYFTISDFAKLMGISRQTLIYYDRIGLFKPVKTLDNGYRLYARSQINVISLISMLSEMGVPLREIKAIVDRISPDKAIEILKKQRDEAQEKLRRLQRLTEMIDRRIGQITCGKEVAEMPAPPFGITVIDEDIPLYVGEEVNSAMGDFADDFIIDFYAKCEALHFPLIFSGGQMKSRENIEAGRTGIISRMCFTLQNPDGANAVIPKGLYAVGYTHGDYGNTEDIYKNLLTYIRENGMQIAGDAYEEYLLDELAESDPQRFVMRILIQVEKDGAAPAKQAQKEEEIGCSDS